MNGEARHRGHRGRPENAGAGNRLPEPVIGAASEVHRELGPGLLESACQRALADEPRLRGIRFEEQKLCPVRYKDLVIDDAYRLDFLVDGAHGAGVGVFAVFECPIGLWLNSRSTVLTKGLRRIAL